MDKRQDAITRAKEAALSSVSFGVKATSVEADKLKRVSYVAAKEAVLFRKNVELLVIRFKTLDSIVANVKKVLASKATPDKKLARITSIIIADGNKYKEAEAILEEKASVSDLTNKVTSDITKATIGAAAFALAIPLLLSPKVREYIKSFFKGFLDGLGLSEKNLLKLKVTIIGVASVLGAVFTIKALNSVVVAFSRMKKLAQLLGILATATSESGIDFDLERGKKAKKLKQAKRLKRLITAASSLLKASVAAYAVGTAIDALGGTLIDVAMSDEDIDAENLLAITLNNIVESATMGTVTTDVRKHADKMDYEAAFPLGDSTSNSTPPAAPDKNWNTDPNVIEVDTDNSKTNKEELVSPPVTVTAPRSNPKPIKKAPTINEAFPLNENNKPKEDKIKDAFGSLTPSNPIVVATVGRDINSMSNKVSVAEELVINNRNIILVDSSTNVYQPAKQNRQYPNQVYSATVGA